VALAALTLTVILFARAWQGRAPRAAAALQRPVVAVARVEPEDLFKEITIPAEFRPYT
jgi:hypothetical protein